MSLICHFVSSTREGMLYLVYHCTSCPCRLSLEEAMDRWAQVYPLCRPKCCFLDIALKGNAETANNKEADSSREQVEQVQKDEHLQCLGEIDQSVIYSSEKVYTLPERACEGLEVRNIPDCYYLSRAPCVICSMYQNKAET